MGSQDTLPDVDEELSRLEEELEKASERAKDTIEPHRQAQEDDAQEDKDIAKDAEQTSSDAGQPTDAEGKGITAAAEAAKTEASKPCTELSVPEPASKRQALTMKPAIKPKTEGSTTLPKPALESHAKQPDKTKSKRTATKVKAKVKDTAGAKGADAAVKQPRAQTAYAFFVAARRASVKEAKPELSFGELSKELGSIWKTMSDEQKAPFQAQAAEDKERVDKLKKDMPPISQSAAKEAKAKHQRARSPYQFFCASQRDSMKASNPDAGFGDIAKLLAGAWKEISEQDKQVYINKHQAEKEKLAATGDSSCKSSDNKGSRAQSRSPGLTNLSKDDTESQDAASHHKNDCQGPCSITEASTDMGGKSEDISERAKQRAPQSRSKGSRKQHQPAPAAEESDDEEERQNCDWSEHPAQIIMGETMHSKYLVKRQGADYTDYGLVDAKAVKRQRLQGSQTGPICLDLVAEYEEFVRRFKQSVHNHKDGSALDLEVLERNSPLEMCYYLGKLMESNFPLSKLADKAADRMIKVPMLGLSMAVQRIVDAERKVAVDRLAELNQLKAQQTILEGKLAHLQKAGLSAAAEQMMEE